MNLYSNDLSLRDPILDLMKLISLVEYRVKYENSNYYAEKTSILFKFFCESLEDPKALRYFVEIFENLALNSNQ